MVTSKKSVKDLPNPFESKSKVDPTVGADEASVQDTPAPAVGPSQLLDTSLESIVATMARQMAALVAEQASLKEELVRARNGGPMEQPSGGVPSAKEAMAQILRREEIDRSTEQAFWARMTPFDQEAGNVAHTRGFGYLKSDGGEYLHGGTGLPGDVPRWRMVTKQEALRLALEKQYPNKRFSRAACQLTTSKGRKLIDAYEEMVRYRSGGMRALSVSEAVSADNYGREGGIIEDSRPALATPRVQDMVQESSTAGSGAGKALIGEIGPDQRSAAAALLADLPEGEMSAVSYVK